MTLPIIAGAILLWLLLGFIVAILACPMLKDSNTADTPPDVRSRRVIPRIAATRHSPARKPR